MVDRLRPDVRGRRLQEALQEGDDLRRQLAGHLLAEEGPLRVVPGQEGVLPPALRDHHLPLLLAHVGGRVAPRRSHRHHEPLLGEPDRLPVHCSGLLR